jgi:hypothetical protein
MNTDGWARLSDSTIPNEKIKLYEKQAKISDNEHFIFRGNAFS